MTTCVLFFHSHLLVMEFETTFQKNWLTRHPRHNGGLATLAIVVFLLAAGLAFHFDLLGLSHFMPAGASYSEIWRPWTAIFAHADAEHLLGNLVLFIPFSYLLVGYFGYAFFPLGGLFIGGLINIVTTFYLPAGVSVIGASGVVYWMGSAWITLAYFIDRRESRSLRFLKAAGVSMLLFLPSTYRAEVSYSTHFVGFTSGIVSASGYYFINREKFLSAEETIRRVTYYPVWEGVEFEPLPAPLHPSIPLVEG
ncbi:MAG: rhomboid family intramembrane serine protease [Cryobacterium sp.]|nr:rhomboid family intramembrane serine protease [Oligoflexia bacterium]